MLTPQEYIAGIRAGNRVLLGQAITLVESTRADHQERARAVLAGLASGAPDRPAGIRIAVTGSPGVGKSTFIEALGMHLTGSGKRVAVLAVDPSSAWSKGSILGDKTRMERLSASEQAFIRPSSAGDSLGGVARRTRETILLMEAAGYDHVLIETVGVGQSEWAVHRMTDVFLLLLLPGAGDELQGIKRGIVEMADLLVVNKADGDRLSLANQARAHYRNAVHLLPPKPSGWTPRVLTCSAASGAGIAEIAGLVGEYRNLVETNGFLDQNRRQQDRYWFRDALQQGLQAAFYSHPAVRAEIKHLEAEVLAGRLSPFAAAEQLLQIFLSENKGGPTGPKQNSPPS